MHLNFNALPALIALAILVAVFAAISRHPTQQRVHVGLAGWGLVLLRATVHFATLPNPRWHRLDLSIGLCSLELASMVFVVSVAPKANTVRRQLLLGSVLAVPAFAYTVAMIWDVSSPTFYYCVVVLGLALGLLLLRRWYEKITLYVVNVSLALVVL